MVGEEYMKTVRTKNRIREGSPVATAILYLLTILVCLATVYPMCYVLILSISAPEYAAGMDVPQGLFPGCL